MSVYPKDEFPRKLRGAVPTTKSNRRPCPQCEAADAATHPLAIGAVVTVLRVRDGLFVPEGIATVLRTSSEPDTYFVRFLTSDKSVRRRMIFPDYQYDPTRMIDLINRLLNQDVRPS
jgi:hypothetical protein